MGTRVLDVDLLRELQRKSGSEDPHAQYLLERYAECQTEALGGQILKCKACGTRVVHYNPCNVRGCPKCAAYHQGRWRRAMHERILPVGHQHVVFSGPGWLAQLWLKRPKAVMDALFAAASAAVKTTVTADGLCYAATMVFHSHGNRMCYKPHVHCLLTVGGFDDHDRWREQRHLDEPGLRKRFDHRLLKRLERDVPEELNQVIGHRGGQSSVHATYHEQTPDSIVAYLAGTTHGLVLKAKTVLEVGEHTVGYTAEHHGHRQRVELSQRDFLRRYLAHIPPHRSVTVRHYGLYATRHAEELEQARRAIEAAPRQIDPPAEEELFLPVCPHCHRRTLIGQLEFEPHATPAELRLLAIIRGSPVPHDTIITAAPSAVPIG